MKKLLPLILVFATIALQAQKKKDLIVKIGELEQTISALKDSVSVAKRQINISNSNAELANKEAEELRAANATLLQNLTNFSKISKQNTETVNSALSSLNEKEQQLRLISDEFAKNDSTAIAILSQTKQILGPTAKVGATNGSISLNITGDFDVSYSQAVAVANELWKTNSIPAERLHIASKDGNFKEGITIRLSPNLANFYSLAKEKM